MKLKTLKELFGKQKVDDKLDRGIGCRDMFKPDSYKGKLLGLELWVEPNMNDDELLIIDRNQKIIGVECNENKNIRWA